MILLTDAVKLIDEIDRIYSEHYATSESQAIHDIFRAVERRIRRYLIKAVPDIENIYLKRRYDDAWVMFVRVCFCDRRYEIMVKLPKEINDPNCRYVEVKNERRTEE